jgi:hypothetical protein
MKKEFSVKKYNEATVYTLESASGGGTSAGAVASVSMPMGGVRKRGDNLIAQEANKDKVPATTPRNFVAKNAKSSGAGAHKDKKKAEKQGDFKHKKSYADALQEMTDAEVAKIRSDAAAHLTAQLNKPKEVPKKKSFMQQVGDKQLAMAKGAWKGLTGQTEDHTTAADGWGRGSYDTYAGGRHGRGVAENPEWYNDEANGMTTAQLKSLVKHAAKLRQAVKAMQAQGDTLEPWQQSKVTKAADYLDAVFNAVDDEHDMGEEQGVAEAQGRDEIGSAGVAYQAGYQDGKRAKASGVNPKVNTAAWGEYITDYRRGMHDAFNLPAKGVAETTGDPKFDKMLKGITGKKEVAKQQKADTKQQARDAFGSMFGGGNPTDKLSIRKKDVSEDAYMQELASKLAEKIPSDAPVDVWVKDFQKADPNKYHQFKNKTPEKKSQMAAAASYAAKNPNKKK